MNVNKYFHLLLESLNVPQIPVELEAFNFLENQSPIPEVISSVIKRKLDSSNSYYLINSEDLNFKLMVTNKQTTAFISKRDIFYYDADFNFITKVSNHFQYATQGKVYNFIESQKFSMDHPQSVKINISNDYFKNLFITIMTMNKNAAKVESTEVRSKNKNKMGWTYLNLDVNTLPNHPFNVTNFSDPLIEQITTNSKKEIYSLELTKEAAKNLNLDKKRLDIKNYEDLKNKLKESIEIQNLTTDTKTKIMSKKAFESHMNVITSLITNKDFLFNIDFEKTHNKIMNNANLIVQDITTSYDNELFYRELLHRVKNVGDYTSGLAKHLHEQIFISKALFLINDNKIDLIDNKIMSDLIKMKNSVDFLSSEFNHKEKITPKKKNNKNEK